MQKINLNQITEEVINIYNINEWLTSGIGGKDPVELGYNNLADIPVINMDIAYPIDSDWYDLTTATAKLASLSDTEVAKILQTGLIITFNNVTDSKQKVYQLQKRNPTKAELSDITLWKELGPDLTSIENTIDDISEAVSGLTSDLASVDEQVSGIVEDGYVKSISGFYKDDNDLVLKYVDSGDNSQNLTLPLVTSGTVNNTDEAPGLLSVEDYKEFKGYQKEIDAISGKGKVYPYDFSTEQKAAAAEESTKQATLLAIYKEITGESEATAEDIPDQTKIVDEDDNLVFTFYDTDKEWHGPTNNTVPTATNNDLGIVKGSPSYGITINAGEIRLSHVTKKVVFATAASFTPIDDDEDPNDGKVVFDLTSQWPAEPAATVLSSNTTEVYLNGVLLFNGEYSIDGKKVVWEDAYELDGTSDSILIRFVA